MDIPRILGIDNDDFRVVFGGTKIDYDIEKDDINRKKHGYSLESACDVLERWIMPVGSCPIMVTDSMRGKEKRHRVIGKDDEGNIVTIITTMREEETIRIISFRRSHKKEIKDYADHLKYIIGTFR